MKQRLASLFLLLVLFGGAFAGVPPSFSDSHCTMSGMMDMDCCKAALLQNQSTKISEGELLCALECAQNGTTLPSTSVRVNPPAQKVQPLHPASVLPLLTPPSFLRSATAQTHSPPGAPPTYLKNLILLI